MKKIAISFVAFSLIASVSTAWAWSDVTGTVDKVDTQARQITLDDGKTYTREPSVSLASVKTGDKVTLSVEKKSDGTNVANKLMKAS